MSLSPRIYVAVAASIALVAWTYFSLTSPRHAEEATAGGDATPIVAVSVPATLSDRAGIGRQVFEKHCMACHGQNAVGLSGLGPPLVHKIYEPSHHADEAFLLAAKRGVRQHHWGFGDMPPVDGVTLEEVGTVVDYVRELQRANGIN